MKNLKKGPLSKTEKELIDNSKEKDIIKIAKNLGRTTTIVENYLSSKKETKEITTEKYDSMNLYARKKDRGVVVMTESASSDADKNKKKPQLPKRYQSIIHKIKEN